MYLQGGRTHSGMLFVSLPAVCIEMATFVESARFLFLFLRFLSVVVLLLEFIQNYRAAASFSVLLPADLEMDVSLASVV